MHQSGGSTLTAGQQAGRLGLTHSAIAQGGFDLPKHYADQLEVRESSQRVSIPNRFDQLAFAKE